ncbi:MAG: SDR family NAD(P)-dependent oxidoreductase [Myxococcota bacterium]|nr:SDR family NAD(P)-dependent oxidoreductase [Myxococcota bacterium]
MSDSAGRWGFQSPYNALVLGARDGIGGAFVEALLDDPNLTQVIQTSRSEDWCRQGVSDREKRIRLDLADAESLAGWGQSLQSLGVPIHLMINCTGILHGEGVRPERSWRQIDQAAMQHSFQVHATGLALVLAEVMNHVPRDQRSVLASLSARIGSIEDNRLGGWFSYRASKAAQNMILKTASIEAARRWPQLAIVALHPGTVHSALSAPFASRLPEGRVFEPSQSVEYLRAVVERLTPSDTGTFWAWDGTPIPW